MDRIKAALGIGRGNVNVIPVDEMRTSIPIQEVPDQDLEPSKASQFFRQVAGDAQAHDNYRFSPAYSSSNRSQTPSNPLPSTRRTNAPIAYPSARWDEEDGVELGRPIDPSALMHLRRLHLRTQPRGQTDSGADLGEHAPLRIGGLDFRAMREPLAAAPMRALHDEVQERYRAPVEFRTEPMRSTTIQRPFVDEHGVQHYNANLYADAVAAASARATATTDSRPEAGRPLHLPQGHLHLGNAVSHNVRPVTGGPQRSRAGHLDDDDDAYDSRRNRHHAYGVPENVPRDVVGMNPMEVDFTWSTADNVQVNTLHDYLQSTLVPRDDRVFAPNTAAARGYRPTPYGAATSRSPQRRTSPLRFKVKGGRDKSPRAALDGVGLNPLNDLPFEQRYGHRGWSHIRRVDGPKPPASLRGGAVADRARGM
jgi:hypothetical protein